MGSLPVSLIDEFLDGYRPANLGRELSALERALCEEVLFDFIVSDLAAEPAVGCSAALADIRRLIGTTTTTLVDDVERNLRVLERAARRAACQFARREKSFDIMREHLVMLADQRSRGSSPPPPAKKG
jgi:hypothetical protein